MSKEAVLRRADDTFKHMQTHPNDPNALIIAAKRGNEPDMFRPDDLIERADLYTEERVNDALRVLSGIK